MVIRPGDPLRIKASSWNAMQELVARSRQAAPGISAPGRGERVVRIKNTTGSPVDRWGVLGIGGVAISPTDNSPEFEAGPVLLGVVPTIAHVGKYAVLQEPLAAGAIGRAIVSGDTVCRVQVSSALHGFAEITSGITTQLKSANSGTAQILFAESTLGPGLAYVRLLGPAKGTSGEVDLGWASGCAPWVCQYMPGSLVDVPGIGSAPRQYQFAMPLTCDCCGGNAAGEPVTLDWIEGTNKWESASFLCDLAAACGTQTYRWTIPGVPQDPGYSEWRTRRGAVCGFEAWIWNDGTHGGGARWVRSGACTGGCEASTAPPSPGAVNGQIEFRECGSWEWYMVGSYCQCGATVVGPTAPPTSANESISVIIACTGGECTGEAGSWVAVGDTCACGTSAPPSEPGARDGVEVIVACTLTDAGYTASARWRLTVDTDTFMELVTDDETIVLRYQLDKRKTWCPLCQNAMEWVAPCGPHSCSGWLQAICVSPYFPALTCEDFNPLPMEYSFGIDSISNDEFASDPAWSAFDLEAMNGAWTAGLERLGAPDDAYYVTCADFGLGLFGPLFVYRSASVLIRTFSELNEGTGHTDVQRWYGYWRLYVCCLSDGNGYAVRYYQLHMNYDTSIETVSGTTWTRGRFGPLFYGLPNCPPGTDTGTDNCNGEIPPGSTSVDLFRDHIGPGSTTIEMVE